MKARKPENQKITLSGTPRIALNSGSVWSRAGRSTTTIFFYLFIGLVFIHPLYASPESWTPATPLSLGPALSREPAICADGEEIFVAWSDNRLGRWEIFFRYSPDGGATWARDERITTTDADSVQPAIACDLQRVHLVWSEKSARQTQIRYKSWNGANWSPFQILSEEGTSVRRPKIATTRIFPNNWIYIVWEGPVGHPDSIGASTGRGARTTAFITRSRDAGRIWLRPQPITSGNWDTSEPNVAGGVRSAYVTWRDGREATSQIYVKRWDEVTVSDDFRLPSIGNCRRPSIGVLEPQVFVVWECRLSEISPANVFAAESIDAGETWAPAQQISVNRADSIVPQIVLCRTDAWIFWQDGGESGNWEIHAARRLAEGWTPAERFTDNSSISTLPASTKSESSAEEQLHLVWVDRSNADQSTVFYSRRDTIPPERPAQPFHLDFDATLGFDRLTFSWKTPTGRPSLSETGVVQYHIFVSIDGEDFTEIGSTDQSFFEFDAEENKHYRAVIQASDAVGNRSEFSEPSPLVFVDPHPPVVQIHLPIPDAVITRPIPVIATCRDSNLVECRLQFGATIAPQTWTLLGKPSRIPFEQKRLIVWDTSNLDGIYTLSLIAVDEAGNRSTIKIPLIIDNTPPLPLAGSNPALLIDQTEEVSFGTPVWSPDGQKIAFSSNEGGSIDIWALDLQNNTRRRLTRDLAIDLNPAWHPDSDRLIFQSQRSGEIEAGETKPDAETRGQWDLWTVRSDGSDYRALITADEILSSAGRDGGEGLVTPAWSPTGRQIAFAADRDGNLEIWIIRNADAVLSGADAQLLQLTRNTSQDAYPTWAPDETQLGFQSDRTGNWGIWLINIDGSDERQLHRSFGNETRPKWSPDGKWLLFLSDQAGGPQSAFVFNLRDESITEISPTGGRGAEGILPQFIDSVDWSPDGRTIVYQSGNLLYTMAFEFPEPPIAARIERPFEGEQVSGKVDVLGLVRGILFQEYRLEFASISAPGEWHRIGGRSTAPVTPVERDENPTRIGAGFIGQWDARQLRGEYILRLVVLSTNGNEIEDRVRVFVENERPRLEIFHPPDGLLTAEGLISVRGRTEAQNTVILNTDPIPADEAGGFETQLLLQEGENRIDIKAINPIGLETNVHRNVFRDSQPPEITIDSPRDFAVFEVPYFTVSGQVDDTGVQLSINGTVIPLKPDRRFERTLLLKVENSNLAGAETNLIRVEAVDRLGRRTEEQRRVIYEPKGSLRKDVNSPAIAEVFPPDGATLAQANVRITAILIDDVEIDPLTIRFSFDGEEFVFDGTEEAAIFDGETFDFIPESGRFTYTPPVELPDGRHKFRLDVQDIEGNPAEGVDFEFVIDTQPFDAALSGARTGDVLKVTLATNKQLVSIPSVEILPSGSSLGYALNLDQFKVESPDPEQGNAAAFSGFRYAGDFPIALSQTGFTLSATVHPPSDDQVAVIGYFTDQNQFSGVSLTPPLQSVGRQTSQFTIFHLFIEGGPSVVLWKQGARSDFKVTLRSQGGLDQNLLLAQRQNAADRRLTILQPVYVIEANVAEKEIPLRISLPIPTSRSQQVENTDLMVEGRRTPLSGVSLFQWDRLQRWVPLDGVMNQFGMLEAFANQLGSYALLIDQDPPIIRPIRPEDGGEVPVDRFLVEAEIIDDGSGVDAVELRVDDKSMEFLYDRARERLTYLPSDLDSGRHTLELIAMDRSGNAARHRQIFFTSDIFDFADEVIAYPNPASSEVNIRFNLTKSADVMLKIYNVAGELLYTDNRHGVTGQGSAARNEALIWKCENQAGQAVASGVYIYILEAEREEETVSRRGKVAVVR